MQVYYENTQQIVTEIEKIIHRNVNLMNPDGIIVASTDSSRIGQFHGGAKKIVEENLSELIIHYDEEYRGAKPGSMFPLVVCNQIIGTIGVTGDDKEAYSYAQIVKRIAEIFLHEILRKEEELLNQSLISRFLDRWLNGDPSKITNEFIEYGLSLGIDITVPMRMIAMTIILRKEEKPLEEFPEIDAADTYLQELISSYDHTSFYYKSMPYIMVAVTKRSNKEIKQMAAYLKKNVEMRYPVRLLVGIDGESQIENNHMVHKACVQARKALHTCLNEKMEIILYDDIIIEIFSEDVPESSKLEYIHKVFKTMNDEEINKAVRVLEAYYEEDGSITKAASRLFIHKNTLQNRLKQIYEKTGHDPRSLKEVGLFSNALYFYQQLEIREFR